MTETKNPKASIEISSDEKAAVAGFKRLTSAVHGSAVDINASIELIGKAWGAAGTVIGLTVGKVGEWIDMASEAEEIERRAIASIRIHNDFRAEELEALKRENAERQKLLGISDDEQLSVQGRLAALGVHKNKLNEATEATIGLSAATGKDLDAAATTVAKALNGQTSALKKVGIEAHSVAVAQAKLHELYQIAVIQSDTLETRVKALKETWGDLGETLGGAFTKSEGLKDGVDALTEAVDQMINIAGSPSAVIAIDKMFRATADGLRITLDAALGASKWWDDSGRDMWNLVSSGNPVERVRAARRLVSGEPSGQQGPLMSVAEDFSNNLSVIAQGGFGVGGDALWTGPAGSKPGESGKRTGRGGGPGQSQKEADSEKKKLFKEIEDDANEQLKTYHDHLSMMRDLRDDELAAKSQWNRDNADLELEALIADREMKDQRIEQQREFGANLLSVGVQSFGSFFAATAQAAFEGGDQVDVALKQWAGRSMSTIGGMMFAYGSAALAGNLAAAFFPFLVPIFGTPAVGAPAAIALMGAGAGLMGAGAALGGGGSGSKVTAPSVPTSPRAGGGSFGRASDTRDGLQRFGGQRDGPGPVVNVYFNGVVGDRRKAAREIADLLAERGALVPRRFAA